MEILQGSLGIVFLILFVTVVQTTADYFKRRLDRTLDTKQPSPTSTVPPQLDLGTPWGERDASPKIIYGEDGYVYTYRDGYVIAKRCKPSAFELTEGRLGASTAPYDYDQL